MAVSIDTVYQRVLAILNKENRGYVTPQEFNLFAIFKEYANIFMIGSKNILIVQNANKM